jgi:uncharacterized membrane protein
VFHGIAAGVQIIGLAVIVFGTLRVVRAPAQASGRAAAAADRAPEERERYARGLTDFYRISGAVAILAGILLLLVPVFAA